MIGKKLSEETLRVIVGDPSDHIIVLQRLISHAERIGAKVSALNKANRRLDDLQKIQERNRKKESKRRQLAGSPRNTTSSSSGNSSSRRISKGVKAMKTKINKKKKKKKNLLPQQGRGSVGNGISSSSVASPRSQRSSTGSNSSKASSFSFSARGGVAAAPSRMMTEKVARKEAGIVLIVHTTSRLCSIAPTHGGDAILKTLTLQVATAAPPGMKTGQGKYSHSRQQVRKQTFVVSLKHVLNTRDDNDDDEDEVTRLKKNLEKQAERLLEAQKRVKEQAVLLQRAEEENLRLKSEIRRMKNEHLF
eukprot:jgi/Bigna1/136035/aug1.32_g10743